MYCQVAVNIPTLTGEFDYAIPPELHGAVQPGCLVAVPFGKQLAQGVVISLSETTTIETIRPLHTLLDPSPALTAAQLALAQRLAFETLAPVSQCVDLFIPPGLSQHADTLYQRLDFPPAARFQPSPLQRRILDLIQQRGALRGRQLETAFPRQKNWKAAAQELVKRGWLMARPVLPPPQVRPKYVRTARLALPPEEALAQLEKMRRDAALPRRKAVLDFLRREVEPVDVAWVYAASGANLADLHRMAEEDVIALGESEVMRDPLSKIAVDLETPPALTTGQAQAWAELLPALSRARPALLHGVTGSGKTELYLRAAAEVLAQGKQVIILVPEISLTPQTVRRFLARFPGRVGLVHSHLSPGERYDTWRRARAGLLGVIVGARSALFTPLPNLGLIVVDECDDGSYAQQDDIPPAYNAISAALAYGELAGCPVLLGSATPEVSLMHRARQEGWLMVTLPERVLAHQQAVERRLAELDLPIPALPQEAAADVLPLPKVNVVDMREELKAGNRSIFSAALQEALKETLERQQQAILFLNRRGMATYVFCRACGADVRCPRCDLPLVAHAGDQLECHRCGYQRQVPKKCPECGSAAIRQFGTGTEKVEEEVKALFPTARVLRFDAETTSQKGAHEILLAHFANHRADVLVGTQMLAKGLDLPLVTLVGVVLADVGLSLPDYRAPERTFQVLMQVAGRAGRSPLGGRVVLQTFKPEAYPILCAAAHDYDGFYQQELAKRRQIGYPPFARLVRLVAQSDDPAEAEQLARSAAEQARRWISEGKFGSTELIGPVPCYYKKVAGQWRWQVILRGPDPAAVLRGKPLGGLRVQVDPASLL